MAPYSLFTETLNNKRTFITVIRHYSIEVPSISTTFLFVVVCVGGGTKNYIFCLLVIYYIYNEFMQFVDITFI